MTQDQTDRAPELTSEELKELREAMEEAWFKRDLVLIACGIEPVRGMELFRRALASLEAAQATIEGLREENYILNENRGANSRGEEALRATIERLQGSVERFRGLYVDEGAEKDLLEAQLSSLTEERDALKAWERRARRVLIMVEQSDLSESWAQETRALLEERLKNG